MQTLAGLKDPGTDIRIDIGFTDEPRVALLDTKTNACGQRLIYNSIKVLVEMTCSPETVPSGS